MAAKVASRRRNIVRLCEDLTRAQPARVDRDAGVIYGVKVLGFESLNGRRYTKEAVSHALPLYENLPVNIDHPKHATDSRSAYDVLGKLENVHLTEDGLYADLRILQTHPIAERLLEAAEKIPDLFGLSHNALGSGPEENGIHIIQRITEVKSVDLVADPATTKSLFESRKRKRTMKLRAFLETIQFSRPQPKAGLKALLEADEMDAPLDMDISGPEPAADEGGGDEMDALKNAVADVLKAGNHELAMKIIRLIKSEEAPEPVAEEGDEEEKEKDEEPMKEGEDEDEKDKDKDAKESRKVKTPAPTVVHLTESRAKQFCKLASVSPDADLLEAAKGMTEDGFLKLLEWHRSKSTHSGPRSVNAVNVSEGRRNSKPPTDGKSFAAAICR